MRDFYWMKFYREVEKQHTRDGRAIRLSRNGNDRAIGGSSSGAVCAFTVAWERPAEFSKVFSAIGTYIGLRGAERYPTLIRKFEPWPIKIFLQDGSNDLNIYAGDWWMANQTMERALIFSGYSVHMYGVKVSIMERWAIQYFPELCDGYGRIGLWKSKRGNKKSDAK